MRKRKYRDERLYDRGGRYIWARVTDEHGKSQRLSTRKTTEEAATDWCDEYERKAADPSYKRAAETSLGDGIADHLDELRRRKVSSATFEIAETKLGHFVRIWGEDWPLLRVENDLVLRYIDQREREPGAKRGSTVAPLTIKKELDELRRMLEWARFRGTFPKDPATVIPPRYSGKHKPRKRWLTPEEVVSLFRQLDPRRAAHVAFIIATGARRGESYRARREDIDLDNDNPTVLVRGTKTEKSDDTVPITGLTHPLIVFALQHAPGKDVLFDPWGKMVRDLAAACVRAGIPRASANDLRRTFGKWHRLRGATAEQVGILLRHSTDTLAQTTYARIGGADIGPAVRQLVPILYAETTSSDPNSPIEEEQCTGKQASPARLERATPGLGNLVASNDSDRRKTGTKLGLARARGLPNVPVLNAGERLVFSDEELSDVSAVFPLTRSGKP